MNALVFLSLLCVCAAFPHIPDTPEVIAEKQRFYQLYNAAAAAAQAAPDIAIYTQNRQAIPSQKNFAYQATHRFSTPYHAQPRFSYPQQIQQAQPQYTPKWTGPLASTVPAGLPGSAPQVQNTPEVEAAIADFTRSYNAAVVATRAVSPKQAYGTFQQPYTPPQQQYRSTGPVVQQKWTGPLASTVPAGLPGSGPQVADTPEVSAAKARFSQAFQQQLMNVFG